VVFDGLPDKSHHGWRYATFGPDGRIYISIGAPCNVCAPKGLEGTIIALSPDGGKPEVMALGVRNAVGLAFHPKTGQLFFTDNGADSMGDDSPPDELNQLENAGQHFGFPWFGGGQDRTPQFARRPLPDRKLSAPVIAFGAHVAPLGIHFYRGSMFPPEYQHDAFVAQHGSWNRSSPVGYRVVRVRFDNNGNAVSHEPFIEGWLNAGAKLGRPVDIAELPDGSLLVSDNHGHLIWRISYGDQSK
jgi:glucose/arabinose dehydrogenase